MANAAFWRVPDGVVVGDDRPERIELRRHHADDIAVLVQKRSAAVTRLDGVEIWKRVSSSNPRKRRHIAEGGGSQLPERC